MSLILSIIRLATRLLGGAALCWLLSRALLWLADHRRRVTLLSRLPGPPPNGSGLVSRHLLGHLPLLLPRGKSFNSSIGQNVSKLMPANGRHREGIVHLQLGPLIHLVGVTRARPAEALLSHSVNINKPPNLYSCLGEVIGDGIITSGGDKWRARRKLLTPAFHAAALAENYLPVFNDQAAILCDKWEKSLRFKDASFCVKEDLARFAMDSLAESSMGIKLSTQLHSEESRGQDQGPEERIGTVGVEYMKNLDFLLSLVVKRMIRPHFWFAPIFKLLSPMSRAFYEHAQKVHDFTRGVILKRRAALLNLDVKEEVQTDRNMNVMIKSDTGKKRLALMDLLLKHHLSSSGSNGPVFSLEDVQEEINTFMGAGQETIAVSLQWTLWRLGHNLEIQERARAEQMDIFGTDSGNERAVRPDDVPEMPYLEQVLKECLRLHPPVYLVARRVTQDFTMHGADTDTPYEIPAGTECILMIHAIHHDPHVWPEPRKFDPDRFDPTLVSKRSPFAYLPFSAGPRSCIGYKFAMLEEKVVLSHLLRRFRWESVSPRLGEEKSVLDVTYKPATPIVIRFTPIRDDDKTTTSTWL